AKHELSAQVAFRDGRMNAVVGVAELLGESAEQGQADAPASPFGMDDEMEQDEVERLVGKVGVRSRERSMDGVARNFFLRDALDRVDYVADDLVSGFRDLADGVAGLKDGQKVLHGPPAYSSLLLDPPDLEQVAGGHLAERKCRSRGRADRTHQSILS